MEKGPDWICKACVEVISREADDVLAAAFMKMTMQEKYTKALSPGKDREDHRTAAGRATDRGDVKSISRLITEKKQLCFLIWFSPPELNVNFSVRPADVGAETFIKTTAAKAEVHCQTRKD